MKKLAIVGSGISGLSLAKMLNNNFSVTVFEKSDKIGGLVKCDRVNDVLFHRVGGHVFNSRNKDVLDWFWKQFDIDKEFLKAKRNAKIWMRGTIIGYPLENYLTELPSPVVSSILDDFLNKTPEETSKKPEDYNNFAEFLSGNFGETLYNLYFGPYNSKIWNTNLSEVPLEWLDGKLPMPNLKQMLLSNIVKQEESEMVHATFYYPKENGSQFIVDRIASGINIKVNSPVYSVVRLGDKFLINDEFETDYIVYTGDVRQLQSIYSHDNVQLSGLLESVTPLKSNGTSNLLCECDPTDISWLYLPESDIKAHRIIYTGNFSVSNNRGSERMTCTVEFSGKHEYEVMVEEIKKLPGNLCAISYNYEPNSYVIQDKHTRSRISAIKNLTESEGLYILGRFAEWEYYNMDKAIEAAFEVRDKLSVLADKI